MKYLKAGGPLPLLYSRGSGYRGSVIISRPVYNDRLNPEYLRDASGFTGYADRLCVPSDEAELTAILRDAGASLTPITITGAGSGLSQYRISWY